MEWILWTRTLQTTMQPVSGKNPNTHSYSYTLSCPFDQCPCEFDSCHCFWPYFKILQGASNCESQCYYCCLRGNLPPAQCRRDSEEPQVWHSNHPQPQTLTFFIVKIFVPPFSFKVQFLAGPDRVQTRWEVACQEVWAGAGEDQCNLHQNWCCSHLRLSGLLTP